MSPDDSSIADECRLYRRLHRSQLIWDENEHRLRPTSNAFKDVELSVNLADELEVHGLAPEWLLRLDPNHHLASITAGLARECEQSVWPDPLTDHPRYGDDPTHAVVEGRKKGARSSTLAIEAEVEIVRAEALKPVDRAHWEATHEGGG